MITFEMTGFDEIQKYLHDLPNKIQSEFKEYVQEIRKVAIKNGGLLESELELQVTQDDPDVLSVQFVSVDKKRLECIKQAILEVNPPIENYKQFLLERCKQVEEELDKKNRDNTRLEYS